MIIIVIKRVRNVKKDNGKVEEGVYQRFKVEIARIIVEVNRKIIVNRIRVIKEVLIEDIIEEIRVRIEVIAIEESVERGFIREN